MFKQGDKVWVLAHVLEDDLEDDVSNASTLVRLHASTQETYVLRSAVVASVSDDGAQFQVSRNHPDTSKAIEKHIKDGSLQAIVLNLFSYGTWTDDEMEAELQRSHQSVSSARNTLARKGYIVDAGWQRKTRAGNNAIVWKRVPSGVSERVPSG